MKENSFQIDTKGGLRAWGDKPRNQGGLEVCYNLKPWHDRLLAYNPISLPIAASSPMSWPYPQLFCLIEGNYACTQNTIKTLNSSFAVSVSIATSAPTVLWSVADFGDYVVFCNGATLYIRNISTGVIAAYSGTDLLVGKWIENYKGQLLVAAPAGYDSNVVLWGDIGRANMDVSDSVTVGWRPMPWSGTIDVVKRLGNHVIAYGSGGVASLTPHLEVVPAMRLTELSGAGISGQAVGGDIHVHLYVREDGMLCKVNPNPQYPDAVVITELGYQEFFAPMLGDDIVISCDPYNPSLEEFYISNGTEGYLLSKDGLCQIYQCVSSLQVYGGGHVGTATVLADTSAIWQTSPFDLGSRGNKAIEYIEIGSDADWTAFAYWKNINTGSYVASHSIPVTQIGAGRLKVSGVDFKLRLTTTAPTNLDYVSVRYKTQDKRFRRGPDATKTAA